MTEEVPASKQALLGSIDIFESEIVATSYTANGKTLGRRLVDISGLIRMLGGLNKGVRWMSLSAGVVAIGNDANGCGRYLVVRPAKKTVIRCQVGKRFRRYVIWMPNLLAELVMTSGGKWKQLAAVYAFAGKLKNETQLYLPPTPNIFEQGSLCMGSVKMESFKGLAAAEAFEKAFIETVFTDHLADSALAETSKKAKYRNIIDAIKKTNGKIPLKLLRKVTTYGKLFK